MSVLTVAGALLSGDSPRHLLDHLVGAGEDQLWHSEAKRLGGLEIDDQLECCWLLYRELGGVGALEDLSGRSAGSAITGRNARSIADQAAGGGEFTRRIHHWYGVMRRQRH